jgi:hypothetical protein
MGKSKGNIFELKQQNVSKRTNTKQSIIQTRVVVAKIERTPDYKKTLQLVTLAHIAKRNGVGLIHMAYSLSSKIFPLLFPILRAIFADLFTLPGKTRIPKFIFQSTKQLPGILLSDVSVLRGSNVNLLLTSKSGIALLQAGSQPAINKQWAHFQC